jgi:hypothetical protein
MAEVAGLATAHIMVEKLVAEDTLVLLPLY